MKVHTRLSERLFAGRVQHMITAALIVGVFIAGFAIGSLREIGTAQGVYTQPSEADAAFSAFWQAYELVRNEYIDPVTIEALVDGALTGMLEALEDEYSGYMPPETFEMMNADLQGEIEGIGIVIRTDETTGLIIVVSLLEGAPAQAAGILPGDLIAAIDGQPADGLSQMEIANLIRGPAGTDVTVTMRRDGEVIDFTVTRQRIVIPNVETDLLEGDIAYLRLNNFTPNARADFNAALQELNVNERAGLIFDLRDNPGGLLSSAIDIASAFVEEGVLVTEWFGEDEDEIVLRATGSYANIDVPIVVLINEGSASASEIVAGAIQDYDIAALLGDTTFGKGTVQTWYPLVNGGGARVTIARWLRPDGSWIHEAGVTPDIPFLWLPDSVDDADIQLQAALELLQTGSITVTPDVEEPIDAALP